MADIISKASDTEIKVTSEKVISIKQLESEKKILTMQIESLQKRLDLVTARLAEAEKLGMSTAVAEYVAPE